MGKDFPKTLALRQAQRPDDAGSGFNSSVAELVEATVTILNQIVTRMFVFGILRFYSYIC